MTDQITLDTAFTKWGIDHISFWNGRLLTAEDLRDEQEANDAGRRRLGRAMGDGVASGLLVTRGPTDHQVAVTSGVAVNRLGQALELPVDVDLALTVPADPIAGTGVFVICDDVPSATPTATGGGLYLLVIRPASAARGEISGAAHDGNGVASECGPKFNVEGVSFRLIGLDPVGLAEAVGHDAEDVAELGGGGGLNRNVAAHLFLDSMIYARSLLDPFGPRRTGALTRLRADVRVLSDCEVPIALLSWEGGRVGLVDNWAVRRPLMSGAFHDASMDCLAGSRWQAVSFATLQQFADHLADLIAETADADLSLLRAVDHFRFLPPAGLIPLIGSSGDRGVDAGGFLDDMAVRSGEPISVARVGALLHASFSLAPIDITDLSLEEGEALWTYVVEGAGVDDSQPYLVFASQSLRYVATVEDEDPTRVVITGVSPPGDHEVGSEIIVEGLNFAFPGSANIVTVGGSPVPAFNPGTSPTQLVFNIPEMSGLPRAASIVVENDNGTAEWIIAVVERLVVPVGEIHFEEDLDHLDGVSIEEGETFDYSWLVASATTVAETYRFTAIFTNPIGSAVEDWTTAAQIVDASGNPNDTFFIAPEDPEDPASGPVRVTVRLTVPTDADGATLALRAESQTSPHDPDLNRTSSPVVIVVDEEQETSDPRITFELPTFTPSTGAVLGSDGAIEIPIGNTVRVRVRALFSDAGEFEFSAAIEPDDGGDVWALANPNPAPGDMDPQDAGDEEEFGVNLTPLIEDPASDRFLRVDVRADDNGGTEYRSFTRIRLRPT